MAKSYTISAFVCGIVMMITIAILIVIAVTTTKTTDTYQQYYG